MKAKVYTKETIGHIGTSELNFPEFNIGDTISVYLKIKEGSKERLQVYTGDVIAMRNNAVSSTFTVRKIAANNIAVEKILPFYSPKIDSIKVLKRGVVRRAKLYYIRDRVGKAARIKEKIVSKKAIAEKKAAVAKKVEKPADKEAPKTEK